MEKNPSYKKAMQNVKKENYEAAIVEFKKLQQNNLLEHKGRYYLGWIYHKLERCREAIPLLEINFKDHSNNMTPATLHSMMRKSNYLLARCYAKNNQPGKAGLILEVFLNDPKQYNSEIKSALSHKDFGWINASKQYQNFKRKAKQLLGY